MLLTSFRAFILSSLVAVFSLAINSSIFLISSWVALMPAFSTASATESSTTLGAGGGGVTYTGFGEGAGAGAGFLIGTKISA